MKVILGVIMGFVLAIGLIIGINYYSTSTRKSAPEKVEKAIEDFVDDVDDAAHSRDTIKLELPEVPEIHLPTLIRL